MKNRILKIFIGLLTVLAVIVVVLDLSLILQKRNITLSKYLSSVVLPKAYIVQSGSMEPSVKVGSVVMSAPRDNYNAGEIVTFFQNSNKKNIITHRIRYKTFPDGNYNNPVYITAGDANNSVDQGEIKNGNILGKVILVIPYLGYIANFAKTPYGFILFVIAPATIIVYEELKTLGSQFLNGIRKVRKKEAKDKQNTSGVKYFNLPKITMVVPILGSVLVFIGLSNAFFSDKEISVGNSFTAWIPTSAPTPTPTPIIARTLVINEVLPHSLCSRGGTEGQFLELWNGTDATIDLKDYKISDGTTTIAIANAVTNLPSQAFAILAKSTGVINACLGNIHGATTVNLGGQVNLNTGTLKLIDTSDTIIDVVLWGVLPNPIPSVNESIERSPTGHDSYTGDNFEPTDFVIRPTPSPGY